MEELNVNGIKVASPHKIANEFANHFSNNNRPIGVNSQPDSIKLKGIHTKNLFFKPTTSHEVFDIIQNLPPKSSTGLDGIPTMVVKKVASIICNPVADIINECFSTGLIPSKLKISKIIPVHKKGSKDDVSNYRPVALLSEFSKIIERIIYNRLLSFFIDNNIFVMNQYGFLPKRSTRGAVRDSLNTLLNELDNGNKATGVYFDLSKAFDLIDHKILLLKLEHYGVRGIANNLIRSYLDNRSQIVSIPSDNSEFSFSDAAKMSRGVPQGSILGPILFLIYINDLSQSVDVASLFIYADDVSGIVIDKKVGSISQKSTKLVNDVADWCDDNLLQLNVHKTNLIYFNNDTSHSIYVNLRGKSLVQTNCVQFLGVKIDYSLKWSEQITTVISKMSTASYLIGSLRDQVSVEVLKMIYHAYVQSVIDYSIVFWFHSPKCSEVFTCQKKNYTHSSETIAIDIL
nr:unnamed protein product [Callosobruchus analis]